MHKAPLVSAPLVTRFCSFARFCLELLLAERARENTTFVRTSSWRGQECGERAREGWREGGKSSSQPGRLVHALRASPRTPEKPDSRGIVARFHLALCEHSPRGTRLVPLAILGIPLINCCRRLGDKCRGADFVRGEINYRLLPLFFLIFFNRCRGR